MSVSEAQKKSAKKYQDKNNKRFGIIMKKSEGEILEKYLKNNRYTVNGFILQSIREKIERDTGKSFDEFLKEQQQEQEPEEPADPKDTKQPQSPERPEVFSLDRWPRVNLCLFFKIFKTAKHQKKRQKN